MRKRMIRFLVKKIHILESKFTYMLKKGEYEDYKKEIGDLLEELRLRFDNFITIKAGITYLVEYRGHQLSLELDVIGSSTEIRLYHLERDPIQFDHYNKKHISPKTSIKITLEDEQVWYSLISRSSKKLFDTFIEEELDKFFETLETKLDNWGNVNPLVP